MNRQTRRAASNGHSSQPIPPDAAPEVDSEMAVLMAMLGNTAGIDPDTVIGRQQRRIMTLEQGLNAAIESLKIARNQIAEYEKAAHPDATE